MIPTATDSAAMEGERAMLEPAWFGKRPDLAKPLTDPAIKAWIMSGCLEPHGYGPPAWWRTPLARYGLAWAALVGAAVAIWKWSGWL